MDEKELMVKDIENFSDYVKAKKKKLQLTNKALGEKVGLSEGEISKIINRSRQSVSLHSFYKIAANTGDTIDQARDQRSEEHTSELQSRENLVCRLLLEKKNEKVSENL